MSWNQTGEARFGVHSIDHFALQVPSLNEARHFFEHFGLDVAEERSGLALRTESGGHVWGRLFEGPTRRLAWLSLSCWADEFERLAAQARAAGAREAQMPVGAEGSDWFTDVDGNLVQLKIAPKVTPSCLAPSTATRSRPGSRGVLGRADAGPVRPRRLSHVMLFTPDVGRAIRFWQDAFGLRLSDRSGDAVAFMHARHGSDHHLLAFAGSSARGWHHCSWDVDGIDAVGQGGEQMRRAGYAQGWGTGRHVLGSNYFHYVRDPWGSFAEYSADIDFVPTGCVWSAGDHPAEDSLYQWGPEVPPWFIQNTEA